MVWGGGVEVSSHRYHIHTSPFITQCYRCDDQEEEERRQEGSQVGGRGGMNAFRSQITEPRQSPCSSHLFLISRGNISQVVLSWLHQRWSLSLQNLLEGICVQLGAGRSWQERGREKKRRGGVSAVQSDAIVSTLILLCFLWTCKVHVQYTHPCVASEQGGRGRKIIVWVLWNKTQRMCFDIYVVCGSDGDITHVLNISYQMKSSM